MFKKYKKIFLIFSVLPFFFLAAKIVNAQPVVQKEITRVNQMPDLPQPLQIIDYRQMALNFDKIVFDFSAKGQYWPMIWIDKSRKNFNQDVIGMYTAVGDARQGENNNGMFHEALASLGATLGATLVGINKANSNGKNYVAMLKNYFNKETGWNIMMNNTCPEVALLGGGYGRDWWYDVYPNVLFYCIYDKYPNEPDFKNIALSIAEKFYAADSILNGNYHYSYFDYGKMQPIKNQICEQPDAAAGHAYVLYMAYRKFGNKKYLQAAINALHSLQNLAINPYYEILLPYGAYTAARINAECGEKFNVQKLLNWSLDGTAECRKGWGALVGNWNGFDISGLIGSTIDNGGYGFLMNTIDESIGLLSLVRYDPSYAYSIGKWMLNAANASRLCYPQYMPKEHQTLPELVSVAKGVIAYEGIVKQSPYEKYKHLQAPVAQGDGPLWLPGKNPEASQLSLYGSGHIGIFGSSIKTTNVEGILQLNLLATDFFSNKSFPTYLYYNPYNENQTIQLQISSKQKTNVYDIVSNTLIAKNKTNIALITLSPKSAAVLVCVPSNGKISYDGNKLLVNDKVVTYHYKNN